jgi:hypothetical protein
MSLLTKKESTRIIVFLQNNNIIKKQAPDFLFFNSLRHSMRGFNMIVRIRMLEKVAHIV